MGKGPDNGYSPACLPTEGHAKSLCIPGKFLSVFTLHYIHNLIISYHIFFSSISLHFSRGASPDLPDEGYSH